MIYCIVYTFYEDKIGNPCYYKYEFDDEDYVILTYASGRSIVGTKECLNWIKKETQITEEEYNKYVVTRELEK